MTYQAANGDIRKIEKYNTARIALIKQTLQHSAQEGEPRYYEIQIDGLKVIPRTIDVERFDSYENYINSSTDEVRFMLYIGNSFRHDDYIHTFREIPEPNNNQTLGSIPELLEEKVNQALRERDFEEAKKRIKELEDEAEESKEYIETLEASVEKLQKEVAIITEELRTKLGNQAILANLLGKGVQMVQNDPSLLDGIPLVGRLAKALVPPNQQSQTSNETQATWQEQMQNEGSASFTEKGSVEE